MEHLRIFTSPSDIEEYVLSNSQKRIGSGWEGTVYLANDNTTLKLFKKNYKVLYSTNRITTYDLSLKSFIFPDQLFICDNLIYGYQAKYFPNDLFNIRKVKDNKIDLLKLLEARKQAILDIELLTGLNYKLNDLFGNVLFDGEKLAIIDTLSYFISKPTLEDNVSQLDDTLNYQLMYIDPQVCALNIPFEEKVEKIIMKNRV